MSFIKTTLIEFPQAQLDYFHDLRVFTRDKGLEGIFKPGHNGIPYNYLSTIDKIGVDFRVSLAKTKKASPASPIWIGMDIARGRDYSSARVFREHEGRLVSYLGNLQSIALAGRHEGFVKQNADRTLDQKKALNDLGIASGHSGDIMAKAVSDWHKSFSFLPPFLKNLKDETDKES